MKLKHLVKEALDKGFIDEIFKHCRNITVASFFIAAGGYISENPPIFAAPVRFLNSGLAGAVVIGLGIGLLFLNLTDGIVKLSRFRGRWLLEALLLVVYLFIIMRLVQILTLFSLRK